MTLPHRLLLLAAALGISACSVMTGTTPRTSEQLVTASAVVEGVNQQTRHVQLRDPATDERFTVVAGPEIRNLPQLAAGDVVELNFYQATTLAMAPAGTPATTTGAVAAARAPEGAKPGAIAVTTTNTVVEVIAYDAASGFATFRTPDGDIHRATVPPELRGFASQRRRGDRVDVTFTDAFAVQIVEKPKA